MSRRCRDFRVASSPSFIAPCASARPEAGVVDALDDLAAVDARACGIGKLTIAHDDDDDDARGLRHRDRGAFALDLRAWSFTARTQPVRALGACARDASVDMRVPFRDEYERHRASRPDERAPRGASWRIHRVRGWRFDLRALYEEVKKRGGADAIDGNQGWREVAEAIGAHGRGCAAGHAARALHGAWLEAFARDAKRREDAVKSAQFDAVKGEIEQDDALAIDALCGLEFGASGAPERRVKVENVRNSCHIFFARDRDDGESHAFAARATRARDDGRRDDVRLTFTARVFATQGLDLVASQLADAPEGDADCDVCGASGNEDAMILCDGCDRGCVYDNATRERARENYLDRSDARSGRESARAAREGAANARVGDG